MCLFLFGRPVSFLCTPHWTVWLPDSIRLSEISVHEGAVKLVKKKKALDFCPGASVLHNGPKQQSGVWHNTDSLSALLTCLSNVPKPQSLL